MRPPVRIGESCGSPVATVSRLLRVARVAAALVLPWVLSYVLLRVTFDADDCTEFPFWTGTFASGIYGLLVGGILLARKRPIWAAVAVTALTAVALALSWNALMARLRGADARGRQMRTVVDLGSVSRRVDDFLREKGRLPVSLSEAGVDARDGWGRTFDYAVRGRSFALRSAGACGNLEREDLFGYPTGRTTRYSDDIVIVDGEFVAAPVGRIRAPAGAVPEARAPGTVSAACASSPPLAPPPGRPPRLGEN